MSIGVGVRTAWSFMGRPMDSATHGCFCLVYICLKSIAGVGPSISVYSSLTRHMDGCSTHKPYSHTSRRWPAAFISRNEANAISFRHVSCHRATSALSPATRALGYGLQVLARPSATFTPRIDPTSEPTTRRSRRSNPLYWRALLGFFCTGT